MPSLTQRLRRLLRPAQSPISPAKTAAVSVEQRQIELAGQTVCFTLKRSARRRTIGLRIDSRGLTVSVPQRAAEKWWHSVLQDRADWVLAKLADWQRHAVVPPQWADGLALPVLGQTLRLRVQAGLAGGAAQQVGDELRLTLRDAADAAAIERAVMRWYQQQALPLFRQRIAHFAPLLGVVPQEIRLTAARTRWGSCTARGVIRLNWRLIQHPLALLDYVVVHELAHLREMNHSPAFWQVVASACPDYPARRRALKAIPLRGSD